MNRWTRADLLLALLALALVGVLYWPSPPATGPRLTDLDPAAIGAVRIERGRRLTLAMQRTGEAWQIRYPTEQAAHGQRVMRLLAIAAAPVQQRFSADDLGRYGLADPQTVLQLDRQRLLFGDRDPTQRSRYVLYDGQVAVIDDIFFGLLNLPVSHYSEP